MNRSGAIELETRATRSLSNPSLGVRRKGFSEASGTRFDRDTLEPHAVPLNRQIETINRACGQRGLFAARRMNAGGCCKGPLDVLCGAHLLSEALGPRERALDSIDLPVNRFLVRLNDNGGLVLLIFGDYEKWAEEYCDI